MCSCYRGGAGFAPQDQRLGGTCCARSRGGDGQRICDEDVFPPLGQSGLLPHSTRISMLSLPRPCRTRNCLQQAAVGRGTLFAPRPPCWRPAGVRLSNGRNPESHTVFGSEDGFSFSRENPKPFLAGTFPPSNSVPLCGRFEFWIPEFGKGTHDPLWRVI